ncbi:MAG TPA: FAD-binding oxidoreductase [Thermoleophilaceae bacterium]|nr:FAD-binding oxidoreductase [Thermoleophilaceae bacterium]
MEAATQTAPAGTPRLDDQAIERFRSRLRGELVRPGDSGYEDARRVWNGMIDRRPALIAHSAGVSDVRESVAFAREHGLPIAVRGGGHNVAGTAVADGALVIDLSELREVQVDPETRTVRAEAGATWGDVDRATQPHGLAVPGGVVSSTGIAGLTLSGGLSSQRRRDGMTIDNLVAAELVTADGDVIRASATENSNLLWALQGGGGNFGVVTSLEYRAHPLGPEVYQTNVIYPFEQAHQVLRAYRDAVTEAPDEITADIGLWSLPATPDVPPELHGAPMVVVAGLYAGPADEGERALEPYRQLGDPLMDQSGRVSYLELQSSLDEAFPAGLRYYWKALYTDGLDDELIDLLVSRAAERPSPMTLIVVRQLGGALGRVAADATAFGDRSAAFNVSVDSTWDDAGADAANVDWTRSLWDELHRFSSGQAYLNFPGLIEEGQALMRASFGSNYERLVDIKTAYDPTNVFRLNQNIEPRV